MKTLHLGLFLVLTTNVFCETQLAGNIGGMTFERSGNPYIVKENIIIQEGKTAVLQAGCVFLFQSFCGLLIEGSLIVNGDLNSPVVFTTINDSHYSSTARQLANPFDWNGILVREKATKVKMSNFILAYSVYGIKSEKEALSIENGTFKANGQFHLTIKDEIRPVIEDMPFNYGRERVQKTKPFAPSPQPKSGSGNAIPMVFGACGLVSAGVSGVFVKKFSDTRTLFSEERDADKMNDFKKRGRKELITAMVSGGLSAVTIPIAVIVHIRNKRNSTSKPDISFVPAIGDGLVRVNISASF